jgi:autotransporter translocation and assembly factor TamB
MRMSNRGPPPKAKRRLWLWVIIGLIIACVVICVAFGIFLNTSTGSRWFSDLATEAAQKATQQSK